eukprot:maker-scaffold_49-snap-gene-1.91-mRNA-1 protein AED:0.32 eAED:0.77 QI:117/0/0.5/1/0/0/2/0/282
MFRGVLLGAAGALGVASQTDSLDSLPNTLLRSSLNAYDALKSNKSQSSSQNKEDLDKLALQIAELKALQAARTYYKLAILTSSGVLVLYYFGYSFSDIMYVTKAALSKAVSSLETKINFVGTKIEQTKAQLLSKVSDVENTVELTSQSLEKKVELSADEIRFDLSQLDAKFITLEEGQKKMVLTAESLDEHILKLEEKFNANAKQLNKANEGIELLVRGVESLPQMRGDIVTDLRKYLSKGSSSVRNLFFGEVAKKQENQLSGERDLPRTEGKGLIHTIVTQ